MLLNLGRCDLVGAPHVSLKEGSAKYVKLNRDFILVMMNIVKVVFIFIS